MSVQEYQIDDGIKTEQTCTGKKGRPQPRWEDCERGLEGIRGGQESWREETLHRALGKESINRRSQ